MKRNWRYTSKSVTKYNPLFKHEKEMYNKNEWIGFFQINQIFDGKQLTFNSYLETEKLYIKAVKLFFDYHNCERIRLQNIEKYDFSEYKYSDKLDLLSVYERIYDGFEISINDIDSVIKLALRELIWVELFCEESSEIAVRFGHDYYMYFNSNIDMTSLFNKIYSIGLFVE